MAWSLCKLLGHNWRSGFSWVIYRPGAVGLTIQGPDLVLMAMVIGAMAVGAKTERVDYSLCRFCDTTRDDVAMTHLTACHAFP